MRAMVRTVLATTVATVLATTLVATTLVIATAPARAQAPAAAVAAKRPAWGPVFNNPLGGEAAQRRVLDHVIRAVDATPKGAVIRVSQWAFGDRALMWSLIRAHERGVFLRMVIDGHRVSKPSREVAARIGTNRRKKSFIVHCERSCRGERGQNHTKFFQFSKTGGREAVTMVTSANATGYNVNQLWNDLYTVFERDVYDSFRRVFEQMKWDRPRDPSYVRQSFPRYEVRFYPFPGVTDRTDPTLRPLNRVGCRGATGAAGHKGRTVIRVSMSAWHGARGLAMARKLGELSRAGCGIRAILGSGSGEGVRDTLTRNGIAWRRTRHKHVNTHQKMMLIRGVIGGDTSAYRVFTGSHNWTDSSTHRDEVVLGTRRAGAVRRYEQHWVFMWQNG
jgi:hypothetical protein